MNLHILQNTKEKRDFAENRAWGMKEMMKNQLLVENQMKNNKAKSQLRKKQKKEIILAQLMNHKNQI